MKRWPSLREIRTTGYEIIGWLEARSAGALNSFLLGLAVLCALRTALCRLRLGRYLYATGLGEAATLLSGIRVWRVKAIGFGLNGLCAGLAGMVMAARTSSGSPTLADGMLLPSIAAVVVGGTAITGGEGGLRRTLMGVLMITVMEVGIALTGIGPAYDPIAYGVILIIAAALTLDRSKVSVVK